MAMEDRLYLRAGGKSYDITMHGSDAEYWFDWVESIRFTFRRLTTKENWAAPISTNGQQTSKHNPKLSPEPFINQINIAQEQSIISLEFSSIFGDLETFIKMSETIEKGSVPEFEGLHEDDSGQNSLLLTSRADMVSFSVNKEGVGKG
ncbi:hypothetical protein HAX54_014184 [Datura stramonium]|uniref:Uncharacterized protein n=1 Tax=Datura stramonium TaxID=4076 RepID=A0ABS8TPM9_DATST|nr:hypothetical protein [Datura stramonium]